MLDNAKPPELLRIDCSCHLDYIRSGDLHNVPWYTCQMHRDLGMDAQAIYEAWIAEND